MSYDADQALVSSLSDLLPDVFAFYLKAHGFHWVVEGPDFHEYHDFFSDIYEDVYASIDPLAENIRKLGGYPEFDIAALAAAQTLSDKPLSTDSDDLVDDLAVANRQVLACIGNCIDAAAKANQQGILNFLADRQSAHQKWAWQLRASQQ